MAEPAEAWDCDELEPGRGLGNAGYWRPFLVVGRAYALEHVGARSRKNGREKSYSGDEASLPRLHQFHL